MTTLNTRYLIGGLVLASLVLAGLVILCMVTPAEAQAQQTQFPEVEGTFSYREPSTNADGTPLTDLNEIVMYADIIGDQNAAFEVTTIPALSASGGQVVSTVVTIRLPAEMAGQTVTLRLWVTARDVTGNESPRSNIVEQSVVVPTPPDTLPPAAPVEFTLQLTFTLKWVVQTQTTTTTTTP